MTRARRSDPQWPALVAGANAANRDLIYIGISGDGDSLSIGLGHLCHAIRRNVTVLYVLENNGVYGLTKGQFSASADPGSLSKKGEDVLRLDRQDDPVRAARIGRHLRDVTQVSGQMQRWLGADLQG